MSKLETITALIGVSGALLLSCGDALTSQALFCLSNPLLALNAWQQGGRASVILFLFYEVCSLRGVLSGAGVI